MQWALLLLRRGLISQQILNETSPPHTITDSCHHIPHTLTGLVISYGRSLLCIQSVRVLCEEVESVKRDAYFQGNEDRENMLNDVWNVPDDVISLFCAVVVCIMMM